MTQTKNLTKAIFIILALIFTANSANAQGQVNFSFSINVNGQNQGWGHNQDFNQFFNQVFHNNGNHNKASGHYHRNSRGAYYFVPGKHRHNEKNFNRKKKNKQTYKLSTPKRFTRHLRQLGYRHIKRIQKNGIYYTARAISPRGNKVWVKVDRRNGRIKGQKILAWKQRR